MKKNLNKSALLAGALFLLLVIIFIVFVSQKSFFKSYPEYDSKREAKSINLNCIASAIAKKERNDWYKLGCYTKQIEEIAFLKGQEDAYQVLYNLQKKDPEAQNCHLIGHGIGRGVYRKDPSRWASAIKNGRAQCGYGEQMGIIEKHAQTLRGGTLNNKDIPSLCGSQPKADCNHAVGHITLVLTENNLEKAAKLCSTLDPNQKSMCLDGIMMERLIGDNLREHGIIPQSPKHWSSKLPEDKQLCNKFAGDLLASCWQEIAHPAYYYFNKNSREIFAFCKEAPSTESALECMKHSLPLIAGGLNYDMRALKNTCDIGKPFHESFEKDCYRILVAIKLNHSLLEDPDTLIAFCMHAPAELRDFCLGSIRATLTRLNTPRNQIESFCSQAPAAYQKACTPLPDR